MKRTVQPIGLLCLLLGLCLCSRVWAQDGADDIPKKVIKLTDHVFRLTFDFGLRPNLVISEGSDGLLLVDTGHKDTSDHLKMALKEFESTELRYIINTHSHHDHAGANMVGQENTVILGYENLVHNMKTGMLKAGEGPIQGQKGVVFPNSFSLDFNGEEIWILPHPGVHSGQDILIYFTGSKVVHMGDLLLSQSFPAVGPKVEPYLRVLDLALEAFPGDVTFVSGHGRELDHKGVRAYKSMLLDTINIIRNGKESGKTSDDLKKEDVLADFKEYAVYLEFLDTDYWIDAVYNSLK